MMSQVHYHIAHRLKTRRSEMNMALSTLARETQQPVELLKDYEAGLRPVGVDVLMRVSAALDTPLRYFFETGETDPGR